jgi:hypothetical protein
MKTCVFMLAAAVALCAPAAASAATVPVQQLNGPFAASNSTVTKTPDGVHFGVYPDGGAQGGSVLYHGFDGGKLRNIGDLSYTFTYRASDNTTGAAPYMRVFLDEDPAVDSPSTGDADLDAFFGYADGVPNNDVDHDVVLDPSFCGTQTPAQATELTYSFFAPSVTVRVDDDACSATAQQVHFTDVQAGARGNDTVIAILVSQGNSTGRDVSALLRRITVNGTTFAFDVPPVGPPGPAGTTTIVRVPVPTPVAASGVLGTRASSCRGDVRLTLHAPRRPGQRFISARATLRGKRLKVRGRSITLDLRRRAEGNYDVRIVTRYRTHSGRTVTAVTHRVRSIACA